MPKPDVDSPIEDLQRKLDTPNIDVSGTFERAGFHKEIHDVPNDWTHEHGERGTLLNRMRFTKKHKRLATWLFVGALTFFIIASLTALFYLTGNRNILTSDKIDIRVTGPTKVAAGETLPLAIEIKNNNVSTLQAADLLIEYPAGTRSAEDITVPLLRQRMGLGDISPGQRVATTGGAIIFGEEGSTQEITISLEYRVAGSGAVFVKERKFEVEIDDSPIRLSIDAAKTLNSGNEVTLEVTVTSNTPAPLENVILKAEYPFGFTFDGADPEPAFSENVWSLGDLPPLGKTTIEVKGTLEGQHDEERIFRFTTGVANRSGDLTDIGTSFADAEHTVRIARPFVDLAFSVGGKIGNTLTVPAGKDTELEIMWRNNLSERLGDAVLVLELEGQGIDERSVQSPNGNYDSARDTVTWDKRTVADFAVLEAGEAGRVNVRFMTLSTEDLADSDINPEIRLSVTLKGVPIGSSDVPELVQTNAKGVIKIGTDAALAMQVLHGTGPIDNSGPMPPKAEEETTYTVLWSVTSSVNDITNAEVRGKLPPYVAWKDVLVPGDEDVTYDPATGIVSWNVGIVRAGAGYRNPARTLAFKIGLTPSANQVGKVPVVVEGAALSAIDGFSGAAITSVTREGTTLLRSDPSFESGEDVVVD